jgi:hypothetical protein
MRKLSIYHMVCNSIALVIKWLWGIAISELHEPGPFWKELNELPAARVNLSKG